jgi:hypothetical protein
MRMNHDLNFAFEMYKARLDDMLKQAAEDRLCRCFDGVGGTRRTGRDKLHSTFSRRSRMLPETNASDSGVTLV